MKVTKSMQRGFWVSAGAFALCLGLASVPEPVSAGPAKTPATKTAKEEPLKVNAAIKTKIDKRTEPFTWGMTTAEAIKKVQAQVGESWDTKIQKAYNPKSVASLEKAKDKAVSEVPKKLVDFKGGAGVSGYEMIAPGEFTYKNDEQALEVARPGGGTRQLFFIKDRLWKVWDVVPLGVKTNGPADALMFAEDLTYEKALEAMVKELSGDKGKVVQPKTTVASYYGTLIAVPTLNLWSDGKTQVRLVDLTKREDMPTKSVGIAYEEIATLEKLPTLRTNVEAKVSDASVDKAGFTPPPAVSIDPKTKKPIKPKP
jgi:hypothetical protein